MTIRDKIIKKDSLTKLQKIEEYHLLYEFLKNRIII